MTKTTLLSAFVALARQAKAYGLHILITASRFNVLTNKLFSLFTERLTLRLSDWATTIRHRWQHVRS